MESKLRTAVWCFLGLFVIVHALPSGPEDVAKYSKCVTYADCVSDGRQKLEGCDNELKPEERKSLYQNIEDHYKWKSNNLYDIVQELCTIDDDKKQQDAYVKTIQGCYAYERKVCADESKKGSCTRIKKLLDCHFGYLDSLNQQGRCQIDE